MKICSRPEEPAEQKLSMTTDDIHIGLANALRYHSSEAATKLAQGYLTALRDVKEIKDYLITYPRGLGSGVIEVDVLFPNGNTGNMAVYF